MSESDYDEHNDAEQFGDRHRPRPAPSVVFRTEPDIWLRTLVGAAVALLSFISYSSWTGNREMGELRTELRAYREATDRRLEWLENIIQRMILENR